MAKKIIGDVNLSDLYFKQLPEILKDVSIDGHFFCSNNQLTSLVGAPKTVGGGFDCSDNPVKFTKQQVRAVCDVKGDVYV